MAHFQLVAKNPKCREHTEERVKLQGQHGQQKTLDQL